MPTDTPTPVPSGLSEAEAAERLRRFGPNRLPEPARKHVAGLLLEVLREPMFLLLVLAAGLYLVLGDPAEATRSPAADRW